jgi:hypothetical protein
MPQVTLPLFTDDMTIVNLQVGVQKRDGMVYYFNGSLPFYQHREDDRLAEQRIAFCTYRKNVKEECPEKKFADYQVVTPRKCRKEKSNATLKRKAICNWKLKTLKCNEQ